MKILITALFILSTFSAYSSDDLPPPVLIVTPLSQNETPVSLPETVILDIPDIVSVDEVQDLNEKSKYLKVLELMRDKSSKKVRNILTKMRVNSDFQDFILEDLDQQLQKAPHAIITANASGWGIRPVVTSGLGLSNYVVDKIRKTRWGKNIPENSHFGVAFASGISVLKFEKNGRKHLMIRASVHYERTVKIINWMAEVFAGVTFAKVSDSIDPSTKAIELEVKKYEKSMLGLAGNISTQDGFFEHAISFGAGAGIGLVSFYKFQVKELRLSVMLDVQPYADAKKATIRTCRKLIGLKPSASE